MQPLVTRYIDCRSPYGFPMQPLVTRADDKCVQRKAIRRPTINFLMKRYAWQRYNNCISAMNRSSVMTLGDQHVECMHFVGNSPCLTIMSCVRPVSGVLCTWDEHGLPGPAPVLVIQIGPWTAKF